MSEKLKSFLHNDQHFFSLLVVMVAISAFFLGRASLSGGEVSTVVPISTITPAKAAPVQVTVATSTAKVVEGEVVASKSGTKYHRPDCPGASQIKPTNIVKFSSAAAAAAAGYTPAANCPGLE
jgi:Metal binding domain of Ada